MGSEKVSLLIVCSYLGSKLTKYDAIRVPGWHIALKSPFRPVAQDRLPGIFGVRWFSWALGEFFERELGQDVDIDPKDKITVFPKATQFIQDDLTFGEGFTDILHASPHLSMTRLSLERHGKRFDTVLIQKSAVQLDEFSYGIGGEYSPNSHLHTPYAKL
jgi:hypothetical protein